MLHAIYEAGGQSAVYDHVNANHPDWKWSECEPCETETPTDPDGDCAVCGTGKEESTPL